MKKQEEIVVSLTSWQKRFSNLPQVLDTIFAQSLSPDKVVLNVAIGESFPIEVERYIESHNVEVYRVEDTKVYKKIIPTLKRYSEACVICIDDDFLYPRDMIEDLFLTHTRCPENPVSGNKVVFFGMQCHCGCASLTKAGFYGDYLSQIDDEVIKNCPSDDLVYTYFATRNGHPYIHSNGEYFINMKGCNDMKEEGYSSTVVGDEGIHRTYDYLIRRFGPIDSVVLAYIGDEYKAKAIENIHKNELWDLENRIHSTRAYHLGKFLLKPLSWIKKK